MSDSKLLDEARHRLRLADVESESSKSEVEDMLAQLHLLVDELNGVTGVPWVVELDQDASFFANIAQADRLRSDYDPSDSWNLALRVSLWGHLVGVVSRVSPDLTMFENIGEMVARHGFFLVTDQALSEPYDGADSFFKAVGGGKWFDRFFQYY